MRYVVWHAEEMKQLASSNNPVTSRNKVVLRYNTPFPSIILYVPLRIMLCFWGLYSLLIMKRTQAIESDFYEMTAQRKIKVKYTKVFGGE